MGVLKENNKSLGENMEGGVYPTRLSNSTFQEEGEFEQVFSLFARIVKLSISTLEVLKLGCYPETLINSFCISI